MGRFLGLKSVLAVGLITLAGLILFSISVDALAQPQPIDDGRQPSDYFFLEFAIGSVSGLVIESSVDYALLLYFCGGNVDLELCTDVVEVGVFNVYVPVVSQMIGSTAGVYAAGSLNGVQGNVPAMLVGTLSGSLAGFLIAKTIREIVNWAFQPARFQELQANPNTPEYVLRIYPALIEFWANYHEEFREFSVIVLRPIIASFFATIGFNIGATVSDSE